jgi:hypothetical protein
LTGYPVSGCLVPVIRENGKQEWMPDLVSAWSCNEKGYPGLLFISAIPLQQECDYGDNNKDYYEPFCDFHAETSYPFHAHDKKHKGKDQENYC